MTGNRGSKTASRSKVFPIVLIVTADQAAGLRCFLDAGGEERNPTTTLGDPDTTSLGRQINKGGELVFGFESAE